MPSQDEPQTDQQLPIAESASEDVAPQVLAATPGPPLPPSISPVPRGAPPVGPTPSPAVPAAPTSALAKVGEGRSRALEGPFPGTPDEVSTKSTSPDHAGPSAISERPAPAATAARTAARSGGSPLGPTTAPAAQTAGLVAGEQLPTPVPALAAPAGAQALPQAAEPEAGVTAEEGEAYATLVLGLGELL